MIIPKKIKIGIYIYKIVSNYVFDNENDWGETDFNKHIIRLSKNLSKQAAEATLFHEIRHIIAMLYGGVTDMVDDEEQNERMSQGWYQVLKENNMLK